MKKSQTATIIALAWPDTMVVQEGKWYDAPMRWVGALNDGYYKAGHAAFLLIQHSTGEVQYFDFGRYHTPTKYGRVRDQYTDPDIAVSIQAQIEVGKVVNVEAILLERYHNKACNGTGRMTASIVKNIDGHKAYNRVMRMQAREAVYYGPFEFRGSTCSRLVAKVVFFSTADWMTKLLITLPYTLSATPRSNTKILNDCSHYYEIEAGELSVKKSAFYGFKKMFKFKRIGPSALATPLNTLNIESI